MALVQSEDLTPDITTSNGSWTQLASYDVSGSNTFLVKVEIVARADDGTSAYWNLYGLIEQTGSGNLRTVGSGLLNLVSPIKDLGAFFWDVRFVVSGHNISVEVKGASSTSVGWMATGSVTGMAH